MEEIKENKIENNNNNEQEDDSNTTGIIKPKSMFTIIYKKIPGLLSWGFTCKY